MIWQPEGRFSSRACARFRVRAFEVFKGLIRRKRGPEIIIKKYLKRLVLCLAVLVCSALAAVSCGPLPENRERGNDQSQSGIKDDGMDEDLVPEGYVTGDPDVKKAFVIWSWDSEIKNIIDNIYIEMYPKDRKRIVYVITGNEEKYSEKLDQALKSPEDPLYPDMFCVNTEMAGRYRENPAVSEVPESGDDYSYEDDMYPYLKAMGQGNDGKSRLLFWNAEPGGIQVRSDLAEKYLGTKDPAKLQEKYFGTWKKLRKAAGKISEKSEDKCRMFAGIEDMYSIFLNSRKEGWYGNQATGSSITVDSQMKKYLKLCKKSSKKKIAFTAKKESDAWYRYMSGDGEKTPAALCFPGSPRTTEWMLDANTWRNNTLLVKGPEEFYEKSDGFGFSSGCADKELAERISEMFFGNDDGEEKIASLTGKFYNDITPVEKEREIADASLFTDETSGQSAALFYEKRAQEIEDISLSPADESLDGLFLRQTEKAVRKKLKVKKALNRFRPKAEALSSEHNEG